MRHLKKRLSPALLLSMLALLAALAGTAGAVDSPATADRATTPDGVAAAVATKPAALAQRGPRGPRGPRGLRGLRGLRGFAGPPGTARGHGCDGCGRCDRVRRGLQGRRCARYRARVRAHQLRRHRRPRPFQGGGGLERRQAGNRRLLPERARASRPRTPWPRRVQRAQPSSRSRRSAWRSVAAPGRRSRCCSSTWAGLQQTTSSWSCSTSGLPAGAGNFCLPRPACYRDPHAWTSSAAS